MSLSIDIWPEHMLRCVKSSFQLFALTGSEQPIFKARPRLFGDVYEQRFFATFQSPPMGEDEATVAGKFRPSAREASGRIAKLRGQTRAVRLYDPFARRPAYSRTAALTQSAWSDGSHFSDGSGFVAGGLPPYAAVDETAPEGAKSLVLRGLPASLSRALRFGDRLEIRPSGSMTDFAHYYEIVGDAPTTAAGKARIEFEPGLRAGVSAGDQVVLEDPTTVMALLDDRQGALERDQFTASFGASLVEVLRGDAG